MNVLYCFISHCAVIDEDINRIHNNCLENNISDYYIFYGNGKNIINHNNHTVHLNCNDTYEGLPEKIHNLFKFIINNNEFDKYNFFTKLDRTGAILRKIHRLPNYDYMGEFILDQNTPINREWHFNKCSPTSVWNKKPYAGIYAPYCSGGVGYILSRKSATHVAASQPDLNKEIYEDMYVGKVLFRHNIKPQKINLKPFFSDINHI